MTSIGNLNGRAPEQIMYLPASEHVSALTARLLQSDLEELLGREVKPFIDFDHTGQAAAGDPQRFVWKPGRGVFLELEWTRSGRVAVEGKDYRYFSPSLRVSREGEIEGLPANGAIGSLVNRPALAPSTQRPLKSASAVLASVPAGATLDPYAKMRVQRKVLADYRRAHPLASTDEVFRCLTRENPQLWKD